MKKIIRLTESELHNIVKESVVRILREDLDPLSDISHLTPQDIHNVYVWETSDSYYEFEAVYGDSPYTMVSIRGSFDGYFNIDDVVIGGGGYGRQMNPNDVHTSQFEEWFNSTLGRELSEIIKRKIEAQDFSNDAESGY